MKTFKKQHGMSMLGWLVIILMVGVLATAALKLAPAYFQYYSVASILDDMQQEPSLEKAGKRELEVTLKKRLDISQVNLDKDAYSVKKVADKNAYTVQVDYEVRKSLFGNLDIVAKFQRSVQIGG